MESVRLSGEPLESLAGIDEIINRGDRAAFVGLLQAIIEQPNGPVAERVRTLYERVQHRANDPECAAWTQYQAAYWLTEAMGEFCAVPPNESTIVAMREAHVGNAKSFDSVDDTRLDLQDED